MTHPHVWHVFICVTWPIHMCEMTHSYVWHDSCGCLVSHTICRTPSMLCLIPMCDMTHSYIRHDSFMRVTWLVQMSDMTHSYVHRKSSLYLPLGSVNLVLKVMGTPDEISSPPGWNRVSPGCPTNFDTELTEPAGQMKTTFPMNVWHDVCRFSSSVSIVIFAVLLCSHSIPISFLVLKNKGGE